MKTAPARLVPNPVLSPVLKPVLQLVLILCCGYMDNTGSADGNLEKLNAERRRLASEGRVAMWRPGDDNPKGYPFAVLLSALCRHAGGYRPAAKRVN